MAVTWKRLAYDTDCVLLAGRAGGQTIYGGTAANEDLILYGTSHATKVSSVIFLEPTTGRVSVGQNVAANPAQKLEVAYGHINFVTVVKPGAPTIASVTAGGAVTDGDHKYFVTFVTAYDETEAGTYSATATCGSGNNTVNLSNIPVSAAPDVTSRKIYRTLAGGANYYLLTTLSNNTATTYPDATADAGLGAVISNYRTNTTSGRLYIDNALAFSAQGTNTSVGAGALAVTTGTSNTGIGYYALNRVTVGSQEVAVGSQALGSLTSGPGNVGIGYQAGYAATTAAVNVLIGASAARVMETAGFNVIIGYQAGHDYNPAGANGYSVFIGANAGHTEANAYRLYIESTASTLPLIYGEFNTGLLRFHGKTTTVNAIKPVLQLQAYVSTAATGASAGFGPALDFIGESATDGTYRTMARIAALWNVATDASRVPDLVATGTDSAGEREFWRGRATGTAAAIGFLGATPVVRPSATTDLRQALIDLGLYTTGGASPLSLNGGALTAIANAAADTDALNRITADGRFAPIGMKSGIPIPVTANWTTDSQIWADIQAVTGWHRPGHEGASTDVALTIVLTQEDWFGALEVPSEALSIAVTISAGTKPSSGTAYLIGTSLTYPL
jgi:hypothetical protein